MKSIFEQLQSLIRGFATRGRGSEPSVPDEVRDERNPPYDPYAEMRKVLAIGMLLG